MGFSKFQILVRLFWSDTLLEHIVKSFSSFLAEYLNKTHIFNLYNETSKRQRCLSCKNPHPNFFKLPNFYRPVVDTTRGSPYPNKIRTQNVLKRQISADSIARSNELNLGASIKFWNYRMFSLCFHLNF